MTTRWDFKTLVTEEELARDPDRHKLETAVIQRTEQLTYQLRVRGIQSKTWAAVATRRAPYYPKQYMKLEPLVARVAKRFPYLRKVIVEDLNPRVYTVQINTRLKR